jgi:hypothetical protein
MKKLSLFVAIAVLSVPFLSQAWTSGPELIEGNVTTSGTFNVNCSAHSFDSHNNTTFTDGAFTWSTPDGKHVDWTSTVPVDAVYVNGGSDTYRFVYNPSAMSDDGLYSPLNNGNQLPNISHVVACYHYDLEVQKTAGTSLTRTYTWDIDKSVDVSSHDLFAGASASSQYTVDVTKTATDSNWAVSGTITITNPDPTLSATVASVTDTMAPVIGCPASTVIAPLSTLTCTYSASLPDGSDRTNTATVTTTGLVGGGSATAPVSFASATVNEVGPATVAVTDSLQGPLGSFSASGSTSYPRTFSCPTEKTAYTNGVYSYSVPNTATIDETGQSDSASVTVDCYVPILPVPTLDPETTFDRAWNWTIGKTATTSALTLATGEVYTVNYTVTASASHTDSGWTVTGFVAVENPNPSEDMTVGITDIISPDIVADLDCGGTLTIPAGETAQCGYSAALPDASPRTSTATVTFGDLEFVLSDDVVFDTTPDTEIDECATFTDDHTGLLGTLCASQAPHTYTYSQQVGPYETCGQYDYVNTASFATNDTPATGSSSWTVHVNVPCLTGCTLTQGYWKTHSTYGPAPYDDTWALKVEGTLFFASGKTWYQALQIAPAGNAYWILAKQYIAAILNQLGGASSTPAVTVALNWSTTFFNAHTPATSLTKAEKTLVVTNAGILDQYNNGLIGPGHCSEQ